MTRAKTTSIELLGTITSAEIRNPSTRRIVLTVDVAQPEKVVFSILINTRAGQQIFSRVLRCAGMTNCERLESLVGKRIPIRVMQPAVEDGIAAPLVCLEVGQRC